MSMLRRVLDREALVKNSLIESLIECVKELQLRDAGERGQALTNDETTNTFCWILEALFIHGLKNPFLKSVSSAFVSSRGNANELQLPEPSFWEFILIFCHHEVIIQINNFTHIRTDIGRCRAWLRLALNDGLLISYLQLILSDKTTVKEYYKPNAFLRDMEKCDILKSYLYGIESYEFQLACNSSLLNVWNVQPLSMVGLWVQTDYTISQGIDVAGNMDSKDLQALPQLRKSTPPKSSYFTALESRVPLLEEDEALRVILSSSSRGAKPIPLSASTPTTAPQQPTTPTDLNLKKYDLIEENRCARSATIEKSNCSSTGSTIPIAIQQSSVSNSIASPEEDVSYAALFHSYNRDSVGIGTPISIGSFMDSQFSSGCGERNLFGNETSTSSELLDPALGLSSEENRSNTTTPVDSLGFEILTDCSINGCFSDMFSQIINTQRIPFEVGMDVQNYRCRNCERQIGMIYGPARICGFTGFYYCSECHCNDEAVIPSRVLLNWDFGRYAVCKQAKDFLDEIMEQPMFNIKEINEKLYREVEECAELSTIRTKLQSISIYLRTCKEPILNEFKGEIWPKDYFYEEIHSYSLSDLLNIPNRTLRGTLTKLVNLGKNHITSCVVCKLKGFVCEVCRNSQVIFPFDLELVYKCASCGAVYHNTCMNAMKPCPRCDRWKISAYDADLTNL